MAIDCSLMKVVVVDKCIWLLCSDAVVLEVELSEPEQL